MDEAVALAVLRHGDAVHDGADVGARRVPKPRRASRCRYGSSIELLAVDGKAAANAALAPVAFGDVGLSS